MTLAYLGVAILAVLGVVTYREMMALRAWDGAFFRQGPILFRRGASLPFIPETVPDPSSTRSRPGWRLVSRRLSPTEVAFTATTSRSPVLVKGLLSFEPRDGTLLVTGRLCWGTLALFVVGFGLVAIYDVRFRIVFGGFLLALLAGYWSERRRLEQVFANAMAALSRPTGRITNG